MSSSQGPPPTALHVLLVEDDEITLRTVKKLLQGCGYEVTSTRNGREALEVLNAEDSAVDMVLTDIRMPEVSGLDLASTLQSEKYSHIPVIVMSSLDGQESVMEAMEAGAQDYLIKPVRRNELATLWRHVWKSNPRRVPQQSHGKPTSSSENNAVAGALDDFGRLHALAVHSLRFQQAEDTTGTTAQPGKRRRRGGNGSESPPNTANSDSTKLAQNTSAGPPLHAGNPPINSNAGLANPRGLPPPVPGLDIKPLHVPPMFLGPSGARLLHPGSSSAGSDTAIATSSFSNGSVQQPGGLAAPFHYFTAIVPPPIPRQPAQGAVGPAAGGAVPPNGALPGQPQHHQQQQLFLKAFHAAVNHHQAAKHPDARVRTASGMDPDAEAHRKAAVERFRQKRKERTFKKKVRYESRKRLADSRPRVKGQFVKRTAVVEPASTVEDGNGDEPPVADHQVAAGTTA